ncbi:MFS transporter-like protein 60 [Elsinoe australis]|uniref:MFS transporter-like protein 60 n=1 Tax=Elsinoe australis TaxID=40998 RepID=A0A4U7B3R1_9PEZI|nr:MFS transporter-like protein 60 [Elsinoe australis]
MSSAASLSSAQQDKQPKHQDTQEDSKDDEKNYKPKTLKFWMPILGVYVSIFLVMLDRLIIATAIPSITNEFNSIEDIGWYGSAYMLTAGTLNPLFGKLYQLYSTKWVFFISLIIFEAGSALCGAAPTSEAFIVGRAIAGIGAAGIFCGGIMIIIPLVPLRKRPVFTSTFGIAAGVSPVLGPVVGGSFTDNPKLTWRWCFYINLPVGAFTIIAVLLFLHLDSPKREPLPVLDQIKQLDPLGLLLFVSAFICLLLALQWGGTTHPWSSPTIIGLLTTFAVLFLAFLALEALTPTTAMAPTRIVLNRSVASAMLYMFLIAGTMMAIIYYLTIWFQAAKGQSAMQAGIHTLPLVLCLVVIGIMTAIVTQKIGYYVPALIFASVFCAVGAGMLSTMTPSAGKAQWIGYQVLYGIGIGAGFQTVTLVPQTVLGKKDVPLGMGLMFFMQQLGGSVFLAVGQNVFVARLVEGLEGIAGLDAMQIVNTGATALRSVVPKEELVAVVEAYSHALTRVFMLAAALGACMILGTLALEWKSIKGLKKSVGEEAAEMAAEQGNSEK